MMYSIRKNNNTWKILNENTWKERELTKEEIHAVIKEHLILIHPTVLGIFHEKIECISNKP